MWTPILKTSWGASAIYSKTTVPATSQTSIRTDVAVGGAASEGGAPDEEAGGRGSFRSCDLFSAKTTAW